VTGEPDAVTDADGRFELNRLGRDRTYFLNIQAPGYGYRYIWGVTAGSADVAVSLGPKKVIRGRITGDLSQLDTDRKSSELVIHVENSYRYPGSGYSDASKKCPVTILDGVGYFEVNDFWGQTVALSAGMERVLLNIEEDRLDEIVIDLSPSIRRQVVLQFLVPQGAPPIEGTVRTDYITDRARKQGQGMTPGWIDITNGRAECEIPVPAEFKYEIDLYHVQVPVGYWFDEITPVRVLPGDEPFVLDVPVYPAGAIYGRILRPDGTVAENARAGLIVAQKPAIGWQHLSNLNHVLSNRVRRGTFHATPMPLGGQYAIVAYEGNLFTVSDTFLLDEKNSILNVDLRLLQGVDIQGQLIDVDGTPIQTDVALQFSFKRGEHSWGASRETRSDEAGHFVFTNVGPGPAGSCSVKIDGLRGYRPVRREIADLREPVVIRLEKGLRVTGTVVEGASGRPVPDAEVYALWMGRTGEDNQFTSEVLEADGRTDSQGRFTFSNMGEREYQLNVRSANLTDTRHPVLAKGGQEEPVTIRIVIPDWSDLKPRGSQVRN
jgi:hypothetical protein